MKNNEIFNTEIITSKSNSTIVKIGKLNEKKYRKQEKKFLCDGIKLLEEAINFDVKIAFLVLNNDTIFNEKVTDLIKKIQLDGTQILCVSDAVFMKLTEEKAPQGVIAVCEFIEDKHEFSTSVKNAKLEEKIMLFESVRDPGNIGTIIRTAAAFGIDKLILSSDCADIYSSKVIRSAMGAIFKVKINIVEDFKTSISILKDCGYSILGAALDKNSLILGNNKVSLNDAIIIGNEGKGISKETLELCDNTLLIPMQDNTESLNAAMAATIIMWELYK
jgi:TrmH family RNA methyltransferase